MAAVALTLKFKIVGIVNNRLDASGYPVKCAVVASRAKHLIASADFEYARTAFGAGACFCVDKFCGCEIVRIAFMWCVLGRAFYFVAVLACPHVAKVAFPLRAEKSAAVVCSVGAWANECGRVWGC